MVIAYLGGCINKQKGLAPDHHYHALVAKKILYETGQRVETATGFYSSYNSVLSKSIDVVQESKAEVLVLFLRPFPLFPLLKPIIRYTNNQLHNKLAIHPKFYGYYNYFPVNFAEEYLVKSTNAVGSASIARRLFKRINFLAGKATGLENWAIEFILSQLEILDRFCTSKGIRLIIMGPSFYTTDKHLNSFCLRLNSAVKQFCKKHSVSHTDILQVNDEQGNSILAPDKKHFTEAGHRYLADKIFKIIEVCSFS